MMFFGCIAAALLAGFVLAPQADAAVVTRLRLFGSVAFPDADPDTRPQIGPQPLVVGVSVVGRTGVPWTLTVQADSDLTSGASVIPISNVGWAAATPFQSGTLSTAVPVQIASGVSHTMTTARLDFFLTNSWTYVPGLYTATATFTLAAP